MSTLIKTRSDGGRVPELPDSIEQIIGRVDEKAENRIGLAILSDTSANVEYRAIFENNQSNSSLIMSLEFW